MTLRFADVGNILNWTGIILGAVLVAIAFFILVAGWGNAGTPNAAVGAVICAVAVWSLGRIARSFAKGGRGPE